MLVYLVHSVINSLQDYGYNYGLGHIASILKTNGYRVKYFTLSSKKDVFNLYEALKKDNPDIIGFSTTTFQFNYLKEIIKKAKAISNSFIVCGGAHPSLKPECIYEVPELDAIVRGEGEFPLLELAEALANGKNYLGIRNFWFRTKEGEVVKNALRPFIKNIDELPFPDKESLDYQKVIDRAGGAIRFIFSRGCVFKCAYCSNNALSGLSEGKYFRQQSPGRSIEEIELNARKFQFGYIFFDDDTISFNKQWFYEFFTLYKKKFRYPFRCNLRPGTVDSDMMKLLKECRAYKIGIGIEHGNEKFRKMVLKRDISNKEIIDIFKLCDKYRIPHSDFMVAGFPFETRELFFDTVKLCREVSAFGKLSIFAPYPGTELGRICEGHNWMPSKEYFMEREEAVIAYPDVKKEEIQVWHDCFPFFVKFKFIPLNNFLIKMLYISRLNRLARLICDLYSLWLDCKLRIPFLFKKTVWKLIGARNL